MTVPTPEKPEFDPDKHCGLPPEDQVVYDASVLSAIPDIDRSLDVLFSHKKPKDETTRRSWVNGEYRTDWELYGDRDATHRLLDEIDAVD